MDCSGGADDCNKIRPSVLRVYDDGDRDSHYRYSQGGQLMRVVSNQGYYQGNVNQYLKTEYLYEKDANGWGRGNLSAVRHTWVYWFDTMGGGWWETNVLARNDYSYSNGSLRTANLVTHGPFVVGRFIAPAGQ